MDISVLEIIGSHRVLIAIMEIRNSQNGKSSQ